MSLVTTSTFDVLHLTWRIANSSMHAKTEEVHALAYLACILSVFCEQPAEMWGYRFAVTGSGAPYAESIDTAIERLAASGMIESAAGTHRLSTVGKTMRDSTATHSDPSSRLPYLDAAANTTLALALPVATAAVMKEPQLRTAVELAQRRTLLDAAGLAVLEPHFDGLRSLAVEQHGEAGDTSLFATAVLWLRYLRAETLQE
ncbi:hypothetical protein [Candidatus Poriferisocius sp.]|uniref:hypothetical protein n=1 Tax=Candidatus Poriferisocius sp. TaxID=3101276 RepID=UPI003B01C8C0